MRDFLYDLKRTLTGKFTIIAIVFIILVSVGIGYAFTAGSSTTTSSSPSINTDSSYTYDNGTYNVTVFAFNSYGQPAPTLPIYLQYNGNYLTNLTTDSNGFMHYSIKSNTSGIRVNYSLSPINASNPNFNGQIYLLNSPKLDAFPQATLSGITKPGTTNSHELLLYYSPRLLNETSTDIYVYYRLVNITGSSAPFKPSPSNMTYYTQFQVKNVNTQILDINPPARGGAQAVEVAVFNSNNTTANLLTLDTYSPQNLISTVGIAQISFEVFAAIYGLLIPILASLSAYFYFGKDRANGVLESVITRPVTKGRIILSRYTANVGSLIVAFAIGTAVFDLFLYKATGSNLTLEYAGSLVWTYVVEIAAFTGLIYLVSQFLKSQGAILGIAIALFMIFGVMWSGVISPLILTYVLHAVAGTNAYQQYTVILDAINPAGYSSLMVFLISPVNLFGGAIDASQFGVTQMSVAVIGVMWFVVPILIAFLVGRKRD